MKNNFYITTTLPYVNADPHIGFALEIIQADVIARSKAYQGYEVFFNTGTDEHGAKIYEKALVEKLDPQTYTNKYAKRYRKLKAALDLSYNNFIRTTDAVHVRATQEFWQRSAAQGDIYLKKYQAKYCVGCELAKTDSELVDGKCPIHPNRELEIIKEENYFFRFSKYQKKLLKFYAKNPSFVVPTSKFNEIYKFVEGGLRDFSISRLKSKLPWGIPVPGDEEQVMYVWFDALINYISALGWPENEKQFRSFWPGLQVAGKDNLRQQAAMWQAMLMSAGLPNSKQILIHGFITSKGQKISKSLGNVVDPFELVKKYGTDAVRYYLLRVIPTTADGDFSSKLFEEVYNADLANGLGNLVQRLAKLCERVSFNKSFQPVDFWKRKNWVGNLIDGYRFNDALAYIFGHLNELNNLKLTNAPRLKETVTVKQMEKEIDQQKPWGKQGKELERVLGPLVINMLELASVLKPFLPESAKKIEEIFTAPRIKMGKPLFPRIKTR